MQPPIALRTPPTFDWPALLKWARRHGDDWVNRVEGGEFVRLFTIGRNRILLRCQADSGRFNVRLAPLDDARISAHVRDEAVRVIRHMFSLNLDWATIRDQLASDSVLAPALFPCSEFRPFRSASLFEALVDSVVGQQVNVAFAAKLRTRLVEEFGASAHVNGETYYAYPTPSRIARASHELLRGFQLSQRKAEYIRGLAKRFERPFALNGSSEADVQRLLQLRGIGPWSAEYALMQGAGALDLVPAGDVGLQTKLAALYGLAERPNDSQVRTLAERWRPYRSIATYFIWYRYRSEEVRHEV